MDVLARYCPLNIDFVFASEPYGHKIAEILGAQFIPVDIARTCRPISATMIRSDPYAYWHMLPEPVRSHYCQRIVLVGPESSGKSTLATRLAEKLQTVMAPEYGRLYCNQFGQPDQNGLRLIAKGHAAGVAAAKRQANRVLIEDTDAMMTQIWADMLGKARDPQIEAYWNAPGLYVLCDIDIPWVDDGQRWFPDYDQRKHFFNLCRDELNRRNVPWMIASGTIEKRIEVVLNAIRTKMPEII